MSSGFSPCGLTRPVAAATAALLAATALLTAPAGRAVGDPEAERAFLAEFKQEIPLVPIVTWNDEKSLQVGYLICRAAKDGKSLEHYRRSPWQYAAVDPALRHLCPDVTVRGAPAPQAPPLPAEEGARIP